MDRQDHSGVRVVNAAESELFLGHSPLPGEHGAHKDIEHLRAQIGIVRQEVPKWRRISAERRYSLSREYAVAGWASINQDTKGPAIWDVVESYIAARKTISVSPNDSVKIVG